VRRSWVLLLVGLLLLAGCGDDADGAEHTPALQATATRSTLFDTRRTFRLELHNGGAATIRIDTIQLDSPLFEAAPPSPRDTELAPGHDLLVPLPYGEVRCDGTDDAADSELIVTTDGVEHRVALDQHPEDVMAHLHEVECAAEAVHEQVDLHFGDRWDLAGPRSVQGEVLMTARQPGGVAAVDEVRGNVIFGVGFPTPQTPLLEVGENQAEDRLDVIVSANRCDPHVLIEYKRTFKYPVAIRLDGGEPIIVDLEAEGPARRAFEDLLHRCLG
jgi:hypothetical protein